MIQVRENDVRYANELLNRKMMLESKMNGFPNT